VAAPSFIPTTDERKVIHCDFRSTGLAKRASNLFPYPFVMDGIELASMEGFLQNLKPIHERDKAHLRTLSGYQAFKQGQVYNDWKFTQILTWNSRSFHRSSSEYQILIERAYDALFASNSDFKGAIHEIMMSGAELRHDFGKTDMTDTVLTRVEYIYNLYRLIAKN